MGFRSLRLPGRYSGGVHALALLVSNVIMMPFGKLTIAEAGDETRRNELTKAERSSLDSSANNHDAASYEDRLLATQ